MNLKIGGHNYKVQFVDGVGVSMGMSAKIDNTIKITKDMTDSQKESTLLHEIIHALVDNFGVELTEQSVSILGEGLYQVLKDNYNLDLLDIKIK